MADIDIWLAPANVSDETLDRERELLDDEERARAARFRFRADRARSIVARATLRRLLGRYLSRDPRDLRFTAGPAGKPELAGRELHFNVSHSHDRVAIAVTTHIQDGEVIVDFTQSDRQAKGAINATLGVAWSASFNAILHMTDPSIPRNSGCFRPIKVIAPKGSVVNVDFPAPSVGGNTETHPRIAYTVVGALSQARPDRAFATDAGTHCNFLFGGVDSRSGDYYVCYDFLSAGWGGRAFADGNNAVNCINGNCRMVPTEVFEVRYPYLVEEMKLVPDGGGPGEHRGGLGVTKR